VLQRLRLLRGAEPDLLRVPRELRLRRRGRQVRLDAVSELRGLPVVRLDGGAELPALRLPRDTRGGDRSRRQRMVRPPGPRSGRQVRLVPSPFLANGYGYQYEWSNLVQGC